MIVIDLETCGLHGIGVLIQWAEDDGPINLHNVWKKPIHETLTLIEYIVRHPGGIVGFNIVFDWFHICKLYTVLSLYHDYDAIPEDVIEEIACLEKQGRDGPCLKPVTACDLMLLARKGRYQSTMDRHDIRIRRVPTGIAWQLANELEVRVEIPDIYFARRKDKKVEKWSVDDIEDDDGTLNPNFKDVVLRFAPSAALKVLAVDALGIQPDEILLFTDVSVNNKFNPEEKGWAPFAEAVGSPGKWKGAWPEVIQHHIDHWEYHELARKYAAKDIHITRELYKFFGSPEPGDDDSVLACLVAAVRWRGFKVNESKLLAVRAKAVEAAKKAPTAPSYAKNYIWPHLTEEEKLITGGSTKKVILEGLVEASKVDCPDCPDTGECSTCKGTGEVPSIAAIRSQEVLDARMKQKEIEVIDKLIEAGRFHASLKIIGALSGRMSGADGLNPQGIKNSKEFRSCFELAWAEFQFVGGDFESFEIAIAESVYKDPKLREDLTKVLECKECKGESCKVCGGKGEFKQKMHGLFAMALHPEETYESIFLTKGTDYDMYDEGKKGGLSQLYGGNEYTLMTRLGIAEENAIKAKERWERRYPGIKRAQTKVNNMFMSMSQPAGFGSKVFWKEPAEKIESVLGFPRYFTLENMICKALFDLAERPPKHWDEVKVKVTRRDREQTSTGATRSALFGAAFAIQSANMRAANNHLIQATGAEITKKLERNLWELQPAGIHPFHLMPLNIHDEVLTPIKPELVSKAKEIVDETVEKYRPLIPLIAIDWRDDLKSWADK